MDESFRKRLAEITLITRGNLSQREFADKLGISQGTLVGWERGTSVPNLDNLAKLAELRGQFPEELLAELYGRTLAYSPDRVEMLPRDQIADILAYLSVSLRDKKQPFF